MVAIVEKMAKCLDNVGDEFLDSKVAFIGSIDVAETMRICNN